MSAPKKTAVHDWSRALDRRSDLPRGARYQARTLADLARVLDVDGARIFRLAVGTVVAWPKLHELAERDGWQNNYDEVLAEEIGAHGDLELAHLRARRGRDNAERQVRRDLQPLVDAGVLRVIDRRNRGLPSLFLPLVEGAEIVVSPATAARPTTGHGSPEVPDTGVRSKGGNKRTTGHGSPVHRTPESGPPDTSVPPTGHRSPGRKGTDQDPIREPAREPDLSDQIASAAPRPDGGGAPPRIDHPSRALVWVFDQGAKRMDRIKRSELDANLAEWAKVPPGGCPTNAFLRSLVEVTDPTQIERAERELAEDERQDERQAQRAKREGDDSEREPRVDKRRTKSVPDSEPQFTKRASKATAPEHGRLAAVVARLKIADAFAAARPFAKSSVSDDAWADALERVEAHGARIVRAGLEGFVRGKGGDRRSVAYFVSCVANTANAAQRKRGTA